MHVRDIIEDFVDRVVKAFSDAVVFLFGFASLYVCI